MMAKDKIKEVKTTRLEIRLTPREKELIKAYAEAQGKKMSQVFIDRCYDIFCGSAD